MLARQPIVKPAFPSFNLAMQITRSYKAFQPNHLRTDPCTGFFPSPSIHSSPPISNPGNRFTPDAHPIRFSACLTPPSHAFV